MRMCIHAERTASPHLPSSPRVVQHFNFFFARCASLRHQPTGVWTCRLVLVTQTERTKSTRGTATVFVPWRLSTLHGWSQIALVPFAGEEESNGQTCPVGNASTLMGSHERPLFWSFSLLLRILPQKGATSSRSLGHLANDGEDRLPTPHMCFSPSVG